MDIVLNTETHAARRAVTRTIRIDADIEEHLKKLASAERLSVNALINNSLRRLVEWEIYAEKFGSVTFPTPLVKKIIDSVPDEKIIEIGEGPGKDFIKEFVQYRYNTLSASNVLRAIDTIGSTYGRAFHAEYGTEGHKHVLILNHDKGLKWSMFHSALLTSIFKAIGIEVKTDVTEHQVIARMQF